MLVPVYFSYIDTFTFLTCCVTVDCRLTEEKRLDQEIVTYSYCICVYVVYADFARATYAGASR
jgi:hypothetical protein